MKYLILACLLGLISCAPKTRNVTVNSKQSPRDQVTSEQYAAATAEVKELLASTVPRTQVVHCISNTAVCRKLVLLSDKNGSPVPSFYMIFAALEANRQTGATEYFISNGDGTFHSYLDDTYNNDVKIDFVTPQNKTLKVTFDSEGFPTIYNTYLVKHSTTKYAIADFMFSSYDSTLVGTEYDSQNPEYKKSISITYLRNKSLEPFFLMDWFE